MRRKKEVIINHWLHNLIELERETDDYSLENLVKIQFRILRGMDANEFIDEAVTTIYSLAQQGYLSMVSENEKPFTYWGIQKNNCHFQFTTKFETIKKQYHENNSTQSKLNAGNDISSIINNGSNNINLINSILYPETSKNGEIIITLGANTISRANYGVAHFVYKSYKITLNIDNFESDKPDFVSVSLLIENGSEQWEGNHFLYDTARVKPDTPYRIEPNDVNNGVMFFVSNTLPTTDNPNFTPDLPNTENAKISVIVKTRSGKRFEFPVTSVVKE